MPDAKVVDPLSFEVEEWLRTKSEVFARTFDPNSYLLMSKCMAYITLFDL
jgi:homoserine acetyltransferase